MSKLSFTKLASSITDSSVWQHSSDIRIVWVTMMAMADPLGRVHAAIPGLARRANVSIDATEDALGVFMSPDPYSRSRDNDGRRIEEIEGGWRLLNYKNYREMQDEEGAREANRVRQDRFRKNKNVVTPDNDVTRYVTESNALSREVMESNGKKKEKLEEEVKILKQDDSITPEMVMRGVLSELRLSTKDLFMTLDEVCRHEMKQGRDATDLRDSLITSWQEYDKARSSLAYTVGAVKFFGEGVWRNKSGWPWKEGKQPSLNQNKPLTLLEKMRQQEGA